MACNRFPDIVQKADRNPMCWRDRSSLLPVRLLVTSQSYDRGVASIFKDRLCVDSCLLYWANAGIRRTNKDLRAMMLRSQK